MARGLAPPRHCRQPGISTYQKDWPCTKNARFTQVDPGVVVAERCSTLVEHVFTPDAQLQVRQLRTEVITAAHVETETCQIVPYLAISSRLGDVAVPGARGRTGP